MQINNLFNNINLFGSLCVFNSQIQILAVHLEVNQIQLKPRFPLMLLRYILINTNAVGWSTMWIEVLLPPSLFPSSSPSPQHGNVG